MRFFNSFIVAGIILVAQGAAARPEVHVTNDKFDFGQVPTNSTVAHYFWLKSTGADTLRIEKVKTGCTCALMPLEKDWLAPGDSMHVGIFWDLKNHIGKTGRYPYILTNAGSEPQQISLTAEVVAGMDEAEPVSVKPFKLELAQAPAATVDSIAFVLTNRSDREYSCQIVSDPMKECDVVIPQRLHSKSDTKGYVRLRREFADTEFRGSVTIALTGGQPLRITLPVRYKRY